MSTFTDEPSVLTWACALAPRPRAPAPTGRHWWREYVTETWRAAYDAWQIAHEEASRGYEAEAAEHRAANPPPTLRATMTGLSSGQLAPERHPR